MWTDTAPFAMTTPNDAVHTIVVGAGPAGLAVGACLKRVGIPCVMLEQTAKVGATWHRHYDRLHLHTAKAYSGLPFVPFPKDYPRYPSRLQVIAYLEAYARQFRLEPRFGQQVIAARYANGCWEVETQDTRYQATNLVIATGYNREPYLPNWPGQVSFRGTLLHSSQYRNGEPFRNQKVLVVGFGNSGGEIAIDLWEHGAQASLAVRGPVNVIPRELFGIPILATGYRPRVNAFLEGASVAHDENGTPFSSGHETPIPGLYFCGFDVSPTGMLREIAVEARRISAAIAQQHARVEIQS